MKESTARFTQRYARYTLNPLDDSFIRYAGPHLAPWEEDTQVLDISLSGLAFTTPHDLAPMLGEIIKIQFRTPNDQDMASYALVTRIEIHSADKHLVAVKFYKMTMDQRVHLASGLAKKIKQALAQSNALSTTEMLYFIRGNFVKLLLWLPLLASLAWIYAWSSPAMLKLATSFWP